MTVIKTDPGMEMIAMEISAEQMCAAFEYFANHKVFQRPVTVLSVTKGTISGYGFRIEYEPKPNKTPQQIETLVDHEKVDYE